MEQSPLFLHRMSHHPMRIQKKKRNKNNMKIADLAKELKITEKYINDKIHTLKLRSKDGGEITAVVEMILRDAMADEGIGQKVVDEPETPKKKTVKKVKSPAETTDKPKPKKSKPAPAKK